MSEVTRILDGLKQGDAKSTDELLPLVYQELRRLAAQRMAKEGAGHTLQPTALVHEAWLRLAEGQNQQWDNRGHFFAAAAEAMRRILIENARRKHSLKRGAKVERLNLEELEVASISDPETMLLVNDALEKFEQEDPAAAQLVKLRFFAGLTRRSTSLLPNLPAPSSARTS